MPRFTRSRAASDWGGEIPFPLQKSRRFEQ